MSNRPRALVLLSGGIDSAACAHFLRQAADVEGLFVEFGQSAAERERTAATRLASALGVPFQTYTLTPPRQSGPGELVGRNAFLVSTALFVSAGRHDLFSMGIHAGTPYYDCSPAFEQLMGRLVAEQTDGAARFIAPFVDWTKSDVFAYFRTTGLQVADTYSCEAGSQPPCGNCASCRDREMLGC